MFYTTLPDGTILTAQTKAEIIAKIKEYKENK